MTSLERALSDYRQRCQSVSLESYPMLWVSHYDRRKRGHEMHVKRLPLGPDALGRAALNLMSPFGLSPEVEASWLVVDTTRLPGELKLSRILCVSSLVITEKGVYNGNWKVNAQGVAHPAFYELPTVNRALSAVMDNRLAGPPHSFEDAFRAAMALARDLYQEVEG